MRKLIGFVILLLVWTSFKAHANESEGFMPYCPKNDRHVQVSANIKSIKIIQNKKYFIEYRVNLTFYLFNMSAESVVILEAEQLSRFTEVPGIGAIALAKTREDALACRYFSNRGLYPSIDRSAEWLELRKELDHGLPPPKYTRAIAPGANWEFEKSFSFSILNDLVDKKYALDMIRKNPHVWLQVELLMWPNNLEKDMLHPEFGTDLRKRWGGTGHLIIENLRTEPISASLPLE